MATFYVETTSLNRRFEAEDWDVQWGLVIFYDAQNHKVFAVKSETVKEITLQPAKKE